MNINYQSKMEEILDKIIENKETPTLLLHSCCAPCSSYVLETLSNYFKITVLYYNPNIDSTDEFNKRANEQIRLINSAKYKNIVKYIICDHNTNEFYDSVVNLENEPEGGKRCFICYRLRLEKTAQIAKENKFDYFTTTLSISPYKNSLKLNEIGEDLEKQYNVKYLYADFKKKNGYKRSIELSKKYSLYRQNFCGCIFSQRVL